jgi:Domain of unknown function (DUF4375)
MITIGPYRDLVMQAYESLKTDPPGDEAEEERPPLTPKVIQYLKDKADQIRSKLGNTASEILAKRSVVTDPFAVLDALHFCSSFQFMNGQANNDTEQMVTACYWLPMEVNNGGIHQYFHNSAGDLWPFVLKVLEEGQETESLGRFLDLISIFPNGHPSIHRRKRWAQMEAIEAANEEKVEAHFDRHTREFYEKPYPQPDVFWSVIERRVADIRLPWSQ